MPADLPFSPENDIDAEFVKWMNEFAIRSEESADADWTDLRGIADQFLDDDDDERKQKYIENNYDIVEALKSSGPMMDRLPILHVTRENLTEVDNRSEIPDGFIEDIAVVTADYIDGFIPGQEITPPEVLKFNDDMDSEYKGSYSFRNDCSNLYAKGGRVDDEGSPAATVSGHETMHKNNAEALLADPHTLRRYALIYHDGAPQSFKDVVEDTETAAVNNDLLGGLGLMFIDDLYDVNLISRPLDFEETRHLEKVLRDFKEGVEYSEEKHDLEFFDVRDEAICHAVSFFMDGAFEKGFGSRAESKREYYNDNENYSHRAGDAIVNHLKGIRAEYEMADGLRGQRFKDVMGKRIPFLKGEENFNKY